MCGRSLCPILNIYMLGSMSEKKPPQRVIRVMALIKVARTRG